jgi:hypothetical protein
MSHAFAGEMAKVRGQVRELQEQVATLTKDLDYMKEIVHNTMVKSNPDYRRRFVLSEMGEFLNRKTVNG